MIRFPARRAAAAAAVAAMLASVFTGLATHPAAADSSAYDRGYQLGLEAYRYGLPLVTTEKTYRNQTSIDVSNGRGFGPANQFNPVRNFIAPEDTSVVAPNFDTLYSIAWLDLSKEPQVIHVPRIEGRYWSIPLMSPYTENFHNLGSVGRTPPGDYAIVGPKDAKKRLPAHVTRIVSPYDRVWIIERVYADNLSAQDQAQVHEIQDSITVTPLRTYRNPLCKVGGRLGALVGHGCKPRTPKHPDTTIDDPGLPTGMAFYDQLSASLAQFPAPAADRAILDELAEIGVGAGRHPSTDTALDPETVEGMVDAVGDGPTAVRGDVGAMYGQAFARHNGYLVTPTGAYGTDYRLRAAITQIGLGALRPEQAIYPLALLDRLGAPLNGAKKYVVRIPAGGLPPVSTGGFWSLTMYDDSGFLVPNEANRYVINDRSDLHHNADGSIDLYIQATRPTDPARAQNWLPTPASGFRVIWRLYATEGDALPGVLDGTGWKPPAILPAA